MKVIIYHNPRCSKSRLTLQLLHDQGLDPEVIEYLKNPPSVDVMSAILEKLAMSPRDFMRTQESEYADQSLDNMSLSDHELIEALVETPKLMERPIVLCNGKAAIGRPPENVLKIL